MSENNNLDPDDQTKAIEMAIGAHPKAFLASVARQSMETVAVLSTIPLPFLERARDMQRADLLNMTAQDTADVYDTLIECRKRLTQINERREVRMQQ